MAAAIRPAFAPAIACKGEVGWNPEVAQSDAGDGALTPMTGICLSLDQVLEGDCLEILGSLPEESIDLVFADPPYNLQLRQELWRPNMTRVDGVDDAWDQFESFETYDSFSRRWLAACRRALKPDGSLWVIGSYHNIYRLGSILQDLGFWILNDVIWIKTNPMPNFRGVRFTNAHETLIWAARSRASRPTFNHHAMKALNDDLQMRSDWTLPICSGPERLKLDGRKAHATQKPEALLYRVLLASSDPGDVVLDPFFGTGTTGAVAKRLHRHWIGIERQPEYVALARERLAGVQPETFDARIFDVSDQRRRARRVPFASLLEAGLLQPGQKLYFRRDRALAAAIKPDGHLRLPDFEGSIHQAARHLAGTPSNGWDSWYYEDQAGNLSVLDRLRQQMRKAIGASDGDGPSSSGEAG
jgi:site-specific DNA-methyltransferase (adenine-specific)